MIDGSALDFPLAPGTTVVTATERLARSLTRRHGQAMAAAGATVWPAPDILTFDGFVGRLAATAAGDAVPAALPARFPGRSLARLLWLEAVGAEHPDAGALATAAARAWHTAGLHGIALEALAAAADNPAAEAFAVWVRRWLGALARTGCADPGTVLRELGTPARPLAARALPQQLRVAGFDPLPPAYTALLARLGSQGVEVSSAATAACAAQVSQCAAPDPDGELAAAAAFAAARLRGNPAASVAIVVPDLEIRGADVRRALLDALDPGWRTAPSPGLRLGVSLGRPLARYPVIHAALAWLELLTGPVEWVTASLVLRSPFVGTASEASARARVERLLRDGVRREFTATDLATALASEAPATAAQLAAAAAVMLRDGFPGPAARAAALDGALTAGGWPEAADAAGPTSREARRAFADLLREFAGLGSLALRESPRAGLAVLRELASQRGFEPEVDVAPVQVLGVLEAEGQTFDHLWVTGIDADEWPPPARPLPLLPLELQRRHRIPDVDAVDQRELATRRLQRLAAAAGEVVFSWFERDGDTEYRPSPLLATVAAGAATVAPAAIARPDRTGVAASASVTVVADLPTPYAGTELRGGTRTLSLQAVEPAAAFVAARLHGRALPPAPDPQSDARWGELLHAVLEALYTRPDCQAGLQALAEGELAAAFAASTTPVLAERLPGSDRRTAVLRALARERLWRQVERLRRFDAERGDFRVAVEVPGSIELGGLRLRLRYDRVEQHAAVTVVLDYKTGRVSQGAWWPPRPADAQLAAYACADPSVAGVGVLRLGPDSRPLAIEGAGEPGAAPGLPDPARRRGLGIPWGDLRQEWRDTLLTLALEFRAGDFRFRRGRPEPRALEYTPVTRRFELPADAAAARDDATDDDP